MAGRFGSTSHMTHSPLKPIPQLEWRWKPFAGLTAVEIYDMLAARNGVFIVEQQCAYGDVDGLDKAAWHLFAYGEESTLAAYLRVLVAEPTISDVRIGRVLTMVAFRGIGLGNALLARALQHIAAQWPDKPVSLHAQAHLQPFYRAFGFEAVSDVHDEDGIAHVWMRNA